MDEVILGFWGDIFGITFPHECRRSGLYDGTIRKCRVNDDGGEIWLIFSPTDMIIIFDYVRLFSYRRLRSLNVFKE
jgi:hypothetical protein